MHRLPLRDIIRYADQEKYGAPMVLIPEIAEWCEEQFGYVPIIHTIERRTMLSYYEMAKHWSYEAELRSEREAMIFRLRW